MSYKTYTTEAIVCGSRVNNTSDKAFLLFTPEAGMVWATARSVREERSRQRFALQDFSLIRVSLIKGKAGWKVGSAEGERNYFIDCLNKEARHRVSAIIKLLRQFVHGEGTQEPLFRDVQVALEQAVDADVIDPHFLEVFSLRFLNRLGYIASPHRFSTYMDSDIWWTLPPLSDEGRAAIMKAKTASHL